MEQDWQVEREQYLMRGRVPTIVDGLVVSGICVVMVVGLLDAHPTGRRPAI